MKKLIVALLSALTLACGPSACATTRPTQSPQDALNQALILSLMPQDPPPAPEATDVIFFESEIDDDTVKAFKAQLQANIDAGQKTIIVEIDTPGGSLGAGMEMIKAIERAPVPVMCVVDGGGLSMGLAVLQSCDVRTMTSRSALMGHEVASAARGQTTQAQNFADVLHVLNQALANQICSKAKVSPEAYLKRISGGREWWMTSADAAKAGFIDFEVESLQEAVLVSQVNQAPETSPAPAPADAGVK